MERFGPRNLPPNPFLPPQPRTVMSIESGENGGGGSSQQKENIEKAPEGWMNQSAALSYLGTSKTVFDAQIKQYREQYPAWFSPHKDKARRIQEHYHPDLIKNIERILGRPENAPPGWGTNGDIQRLLASKGFGPTTFYRIKNYADQFRGSNPEWFKSIIGKSRQPTDLYHPDLIEKIVQEITSEAKAPEGWETVGAIRNQLKGLAYNTVRKIVEPYRVSNPDWFRDYISVKGQSLEYLHPDLVKIVIETFHKVPFSPSGWKTPNSIWKELSREYSLDIGTLKSLGESFRGEHPEWFVVLKTPSGHKAEHYHPELVSHLVKAIAQLKQNERKHIPPEGWKTAATLEREHKVAQQVVNQLAQEYREKHPDWFTEYYYRPGRMAEYFSPKLVTVITERLKEKNQKAPEGWLATASAAKKVGISFRAFQARAAVYRQSHPEWLGEYYYATSMKAEYYHPDLVSLIEKQIAGRTEAPTGWAIASTFAKKKGLAVPTINKLADRYRQEHPDWYAMYINQVGGESEYLHPELLKTIEAALLKERPRAPEDWVKKTDLFKDLQKNWYVVVQIAEQQRVIHPEWTAEYFDSKISKLSEFYHPELVHLIKETLKQNQPAPPGWISRGEISDTTQMSSTLVENLTEVYAKDRPDWQKSFLNKKGQLVTHFHPELKELILAEARQRQAPPQGWENNSQVAKNLGIKYDAALSIASTYKNSHPEWFGRYLGENRKMLTYYHPDLIGEIRHINLTRREVNGATNRELTEEKKLERFIRDAAENSSVIGQHFRSLLKAFGSSRYLDVLYKFRPEFRGIPPQKVKGLMAEYLGDFLISRGGFDKGDVDAALEHLSDLSLQEGLYETVKDDCFQFFLKQRRADGTKDPALVLERYRTHVEKELGHLDHPLFREIVEKAIRYYVELYSKFEKPPQVIDSLEAKRDFPDLNQLINIREISDKKRMLIADEMGLGKSASVILAKEHLGIHCALTVVPSNVLETWKRYLSDKPEQGGYFNPGQGPRVLVVEKNEQLQNLSWEQYDYILISQERLQGTYPEQLKRIGYDMLIVDEAHKLKTPTGTRSSNLAELTNEAGEHGYLALLSGTPVPNKIEDIAVTLKLLYPEKFKDISSKQLVHSIIKGDLVDLRSLLLPKMQRKRLEDGVEMPPLEEHEYKVELSKLEQQIYEVLLEDDELVATEKMRVMRQFLLNPSLVDSTPGIEGAKILALRERLADAFKESSSVVVFVNDYVEGVLRGSDAISSQLDLPSDVRIETIHGGTPRQEREAIQRDLREGNQRILLLVSGQTADVGVDFSSASHVIFYNEPWTEYQKRQELGRVYRPGLKHALESETLIAEGTIEQGMHEYIRRKHSAIEKLLSGVPITELEQRLLERAEKEEIPDLSVNPELAKYYFSSWDKMMKIFGYVKELGEEQFEIFLKEHGSEYAAGYQELGNRSYQANANRLASTLIDQLVRESNQEPSKQRILDMASGPEMLRKHGPQEYQDGIVSLDLNPEHFKTAEGKFVAGSWLKMPFPDKSFDYLNLSLSLHYTNFVPKKGKLERLELLKEMNRVLEVGGKAILSLIYSYGLKNPEMLREAVKELGFEVAERWTGDASHEDSFQTHVITLNKMNDLDSTVTTEELSERLGRDKREGLKFAERKARLRDSRRILTGVQLNGEALPVQLNKADQEAYTEEQQALKQGEQLRDQYGSITKIPAEKIIELGFARIRSGEKYILFKKLEKSSGAILVR